MIAQNFRDLGGLRTANGQILKRGLLYRSACPSRFPPEERTGLEELELKTVLDLRTTAEVEKPDSTFTPSTAVRVHLPLFEKVREHWKAPDDQTPPATAGRYLEMLGDGLEAVAQVVRVLAHESCTPTLIHCAAGRDRTGIVVGGLLDLLGVVDQDIASDYAASDSFFNDGGRAFGPTMDELLRLIRQEFGSTEGMLIGVGITEQVIGKLRRSFLSQQP